ncbi:zincin [Sarocladium strictum]
MHQQDYAVCGFVPSYILEAIVSSGTAPEESKLACKATLEHKHKCDTHLHDASSVPQTLQQSLSDANGTSGLQRRIYDCRETDEFPTKPVRSEGGERTKDRQVTNCYDGFKITYDFFSTVFGRKSLDGKDMALLGYVHFKPDEKAAGYNNAFWDGQKNRMVFGDGDHIFFDYLTDSLDVIAHELSHGFVQYSSPLEYYEQAGALNESCADVFGSMVEQWHMRQSVEDADWNLGQTLFPVAFTGSALRTLKAGKAYTGDPVFRTDRQPKHMKDYYSGEDDGRGVHINSGIPNHAFYLAAKALGGNSWDKAGQVWYKTMISGLIPFKCDFKTFAEATVKIAGQTFDGAVEETILDAWVKVGVLTAPE